MGLSGTSWNVLTKLQACVLRVASSVMLYSELFLFSLFGSCVLARGEACRGFLQFLSVASARLQ